MCETDYGVAWCNAHGVYIYDGEQVSELLIRNGIRTISHTTWNTFYKDGETMIGYVPDTKQLLLIRGVNSSDTGNIMIYSLIMGSWTKGTARLGTEDKTNLINMWDGKLIYGYESDTSNGSAHEITIVPWKVDPSVAINNYKIETKEFNFGTEAKKKVSKIRITYRGASGGNTNILPKYAINNGSFEHSFQDDNGVAIINIVGSADWTEIDLFTQSNANNIRSFSIQLTDVSGEDVASDFEVNDITMIYRTKSVK